MTRELLQGDWNQLKTKIKEKWNKLSDAELNEIHGQRDQLLSKLQSKYGLNKEKAEEELKRFESQIQTQKNMPHQPSHQQGQQQPFGKQQPQGQQHQQQHQQGQGKQQPQGKTQPQKQDQRTKQEREGTFKK